MAKFERGDIVRFHNYRFGMVLSYGAESAFPDDLIVLTPRDERIILTAAEATLVERDCFRTANVDVLAKLGQLWLSGLI